MRWDRANFVFVKEHQNQTKLREALLTVLLSGICQQGKIMMIFWKFWEILILLYPSVLYCWFSQQLWSKTAAFYGYPRTEDGVGVGKCKAPQS